MLKFPEKTYCNRKLPKKVFYEHLPMTPKLERAFIDGIAGIKLRNVLSPDTMNVEKSDGFSEIGVIEIALKTYPLEECVLEIIDRFFPFYALYLIEYKGKYQAYIGYKEKTAAKAVKVSRYFHSERVDFDALPLSVEGKSVEEIYSNFVVQVSGGALAPETPEDLKQAVEHSLEIRKLEEQISALAKKIRAEKQFNRQIELSNQKRELERLLKEVKK